MTAVRPVRLPAPTGSVAGADGTMGFSAVVGGGFSPENIHTTAPVRASSRAAAIAPNLATGRRNHGSGATTGPSAGASSTGSVASVPSVSI